MDKIAVASLAVGLVGAVAAAIAAVFAGMAPTKKDLQRVEHHTATTSLGLEKVQAHLANVDSRLRDQHTYDLVVSKAQRVSITAKGDANIDDPMSLQLTLKDSNAILNHIELFNEFGTLYGSCLCSAVEPFFFTATVESATAQRWFGGGTTDQSTNRKRLRIRAHMLLEGKEAYRDFAVHMVEGMRAGQDRTQPTKRVYLLEGSC